MSDTLITAITMAVISSLAFIAYKHPKGYARIYRPLEITILSGFVLWGAYQIGYEAGFSDCSIGYLTLNRGVSLNHPNAHHVPFWFWMLPVLIVAYLGILRLLPVVLDLPSEDTAKDKPSGSTQ